MRVSRIICWAIVVIVALIAVPLGWSYLTKPRPGQVKDEAMLAGFVAKDLRGSESDYLKDMDHGWDKNEVFSALAHALGLEEDELKTRFTKEQVWTAYNKGRNNWVVWSGGNDRLWDYLANNSYGTFDLLKTISSYPGTRYCGNAEALDYGSAYNKNENDDGPASAYGRIPPIIAPIPPITAPNTAPNKARPYPPGYFVFDDDKCDGQDRKFFIVGRENRWKYFGLLNEPCFDQAEGPDEKHFGLWLDQRFSTGSCTDDPFANEKDYRGVKIGARGKGDFPVGSYYGEPTGIVGLRLFPNPDFDEAAQKAWDPERYYDDPEYYLDKNLVRPYRVGMSCGFCHVGPNPVNPPTDPEKPEWKNMTSNPGAQYFWIDRIFYWNPKGRHENFVYQLFHTSLPGTLDTSLVSSDNINNPRTMNAVYSIAARLDMAKHAREVLMGGELNNKQFNDYPLTRLLSKYFDAPDIVRTPHVLKDGADSVGVLGALNRVYVNIGLFSEEWLLHFKPLLGGRINEFEIAAAEKNSTYWNANVTQTPYLALFLLTSAPPDHLKDAPGGKDYLETDEDKLNRGKIVFAENCARCHSGKQPEKLCLLGTPCKEGEIIENSAAYFDWMRKKVMEQDFLEDNFLSTERRIRVTELGTNACSPLATNGLRGDIWDNFTSTTYKELPSAGTMTMYHPVTGEPFEYKLPAGGRGYTRPASLISLWSTAPYLLNNSVGTYYGEPSVAARYASFNDSIQRMLWPEKRRRDAKLGDKVPGYIQRTTSDSYLRIASTYLPSPLDKAVGKSRFLPKIAPWLFDETSIGMLEIGPIPKGTPVSLLASIQPVSESTDLDERAKHARKLISALKQAKKDLKKLEKFPKDARSVEAPNVFKDLVDPLMAVSKCPDYVINRGHYFGSNLNDDDKWALIAFLKTF